MIQTQTKTIRDDYRLQLDHWVDEMAVGRIDVTRDQLDLVSSLEQVREFIEGNVEKRKSKIAARCALLEEAAPDLEQWIDDYVTEIPSVAYDRATLDAGRFLLWLDTHHVLNDEQMDCLVGDRSRLAVEEQARHQRLAYARFDELSSLTEEHLKRIEAGGDARVVMNPTAIWGTFRTNRFLEDDAELPAHVVFYAADGDVRTAVLERPAYDLVQLFLHCSGCPYADLKTAVAPVMKPEELLAVCTDLASLGLLAFE